MGISGGWRCSPNQRGTPILGSTGTAEENRSLHTDGPGLYPSSDGWVAVPKGQPEDATDHKLWIQLEIFAIESWFVFVRKNSMT